MPGDPASLADSGVNRPPIPATSKSGRFNPGFSGRFTPDWVADLSRFTRPIYPGIHSNPHSELPIPESTYGAGDATPLDRSPYILL